MTRGEVLERCGKAAYESFCTSVLGEDATKHPWHELHTSAREQWAHEATVVLATAARGTVQVRQYVGRIWRAKCRQCTWITSGPLRFVHTRASSHAATHWRWP